LRLSSITGVHDDQLERISLVREMISELDVLCEEYKVEKIKVDGTMMMVGSGVPVPSDSSALRALTFAMACVERFAERYPTSVVLRIGINHGKIIAGVIGSGRFCLPIIL
jgi:adenylate cyclase